MVSADEMNQMGASQYTQMLSDPDLVLSKDAREINRSHESEAAYVGILLAADAGYDPREAVHIWERIVAAPEKPLQNFY